MAGSVAIGAARFRLVAISVSPSTRRFSGVSQTRLPSQHTATAMPTRSHHCQKRSLIGVSHNERVLEHQPLRHLHSAGTTETSAQRRVMSAGIAALASPLDHCVLRYSPCLETTRFTRRPVKMPRFDAIKIAANRRIFVPQRSNLFSRR